MVAVEASSKQPTTAVSAVEPVVVAESAAAVDNRAAAVAFLPFLLDRGGFRETINDEFVAVAKRG